MTYIPEGYRLIKIGETINKDDAYGHKGCGPSGVINLNGECPSSCLGSVVHERDGCYYYRKVQPKKRKKTQIKIVVWRGMVADVLSTDKSVEVEVLDCDTQDEEGEANEKKADELRQDSRFHIVA